MRRKGQYKAVPFVNSAIFRVKFVDFTVRTTMTGCGITHARFAPTFFIKFLIFLLPSIPQLSSPFIGKSIVGAKDQSTVKGNQGFGRLLQLAEVFALASK